MLGTWISVEGMQQVVASGWWKERSWWLLTGAIVLAFLTIVVAGVAANVAVATLGNSSVVVLVWLPLLGALICAYFYGKTQGRLDEVLHPTRWVPIEPNSSVDPLLDSQKR